MPRPRKHQISLDATPFYFCTSRCVRRAFLCGHDPLTGRSYEHRRHRIEHDLLRLASVFFIDVVAFSVMSNHYHLVAHVDRQRCIVADAKDIVIRWHQLFKPKNVTLKFLDGLPLEQHERNQVDTLVDTWRARLYDLSWFMKVLNENIARSANKEDSCTGHFWECRYRSQALLDEKAVLSAMAYTDLNPIRAAMAETPESSEYTSIKLRIDYWKKRASQNDTQSGNLPQPKSLYPFAGNYRQPMPRGLAFNLTDYLELVDWTGRGIRDDKPGAISESASPILQRLNIAPTHWIELTTSFESRFKGIVGSVDSVKKLCSHFGLKRTSNRRNSTLLYS